MENVSTSPSASVALKEATLVAPSSTTKLPGSASTGALLGTAGADAPPPPRLSVTVRPQWYHNLNQRPASSPHPASAGAVVSACAVRTCPLRSFGPSFRPAAASIAARQKTSVASSFVSHRLRLRAATHTSCLVYLFREFDGGDSSDLSQPITT